MNNIMVNIGRNLKFLREQNSFTQKSIASFLNVDQSLISKFESGERNMSVEMLEKLAVLFGVPVDSFNKNNLEVKPISHSFRAVDIDDEDLDIIYNISKIYENTKYISQIIETVKDKDDTLKIQSNLQVLYKKINLHNKAERLRKRLGEDASSPIDVFSSANSINNLTTVFYPMGERLSGICIKDEKNIVIGINSEMSLGRQRFSMAHELYHAFYDENYSKSVSLRCIGVGNEIEKQADQFASYFLIPPMALFSEIEKITNSSKKIDLENIVNLEQFFGVSRSAILYRLINDNYINKKDAENWYSNVIYSAKRFGYDDVLYRPLPKEKQYMTYGSYIRKINQLFDYDLISNGKYEELLLDGFRSDLVYGEDIGGGEYID